MVLFLPLPQKNLMTGLKIICRTIEIVYREINKIYNVKF